MWVVLIYNPSAVEDDDGNSPHRLVPFAGIESYGVYDTEEEADDAADDARQNMPNTQVCVLDA